jgi:hypothetical protein
MTEIYRMLNTEGEITTINQIDDKSSPFYKQYLLFAQELVNALKELGLEK